MDKFKEKLCSNNPIIIDGGLATYIESMGHDISGHLWSASLLANNPQAIVEGHLAYLHAGADIIISASYQASRLGFMKIGFSEEESDDLILKSIKLAQIARDQFLRESKSNKYIFVAASIGPYGATLNDGSEYTGNYSVSSAELMRFHKDRIALLEKAGADILAVETIPNFQEAEILCDLLQDVPMPAWVSFACCDDRRLSDGSFLREAVKLFSSHNQVQAVGINCTPPKYINSLIKESLAGAPNQNVFVYPNSGEIYHSKDNSWSGEACDFDHDFDVIAWIDSGAKGIGGCCRTSPSHIRAIRQRLINYQEA